MPSRHTLYFTFVALSLLSLSYAARAADAVAIDTPRIWQAPDHTRVVFDVQSSISFEVFTLAEPARVVIDIDNAKFTGRMPDPLSFGPYILALRDGYPDANKLRLVIDLTELLEPDAFLLSPTADYDHRLVIDLYEPGAREAKSERTAKRPPPITDADPTTNQGEFVVAIDPGHGGEDPGAIGVRGTYEKKVVFAIARYLKKLIDATPGMRAVMTREGDYYVSLRERTEVARAHNAEVFISLHADAFQSPKAHGSSVYVLSRDGATSETARWLADKENAADMVGGVSLSDKDDLVASVLLDLAMTRAISDGIEVAKDMLSELKQGGRVHRKRIEKAGFVVLKSPDMASVLVEVGFMTNPGEEKQLNQTRHQQRLAKSLYRGLLNYAQRRVRTVQQPPSNRSTPGRS